MGFSYSFWQETGLNPILVGQPTIYVNAGDRAFMTDGNNNTFTQNEQIATFKRYNDDGLTFTSASTIQAAWIGNVAPVYSTAAWFSDSTAGGRYTAGSTSTLSFMHQASTCQFTVYVVIRNRNNEDTGTTKILLNTSNSTGNRGIQLAIFGGVTLGTRTFRLNINNNTAGQTSVTTNVHQWTEGEGVKNRLMSVRLNAIGASVNDIIGASYYNGNKTEDIILLNALATQAASQTQPNLGNRSSNDLRFGHYLAEFIIFPTMHDEQTHLKICNYLNKKWGTSDY